MASKGEVDELQGMVCPLCLDVVKNPTLLSCGHTFCRGCLEAYDEQNHLDHIACPVCRKNTNLGQNRISGLPPILSLKDLKDNLPEVVHSPTFCSVHSQVYNDIFCEVCRKFICLTCYVNDHRDHGVKKKEEITDDIRKKRDSLVPNGRERKSQIKKYVKEDEERRKDTHYHLNHLEKDINDAFDKQVENLQKRKAHLLTKVGNIRKNADKQFESCISVKRQLIEEIDISVAVLTGTAIRHADSDTYEAFYSQCANLEHSMKQDIDIETTRQLKQTAESTKFHAVNENKVLGDLTDGKTAPYWQHAEGITPNKPTQQIPPLNNPQPLVQPYQPSCQQFGYQPQRTPLQPQHMPVRFENQPQRTPQHIPVRFENQAQLTPQPIAVRLQNHPQLTPQPIAVQFGNQPQLTPQPIAGFQFGYQTPAPLEVPRGYFPVQMGPSVKPSEGLHLAQAPRTVTTTRSTTTTTSSSSSSSSSTTRTAFQRLFDDVKQRLHHAERQTQNFY